MIELLKLFGYKEQEIETELPRVEKAFSKVGINAGDIELAKQRLAKYYDMELEGLRKIFRLCMGDMVNSLLARDEGKKKIIYGFMAPGVDTLGSALVTKFKEVSVTQQCWAFQIIVGCIFDKIVPMIEEAERKWLKAGAVAHCANIKTLVGPYTLGIFPKPDLLITSGFTCETSPKTINLMHELFDIPVFCLDTCQDREYGEYPEPSMRIAGLTAKSMRKLIERVQNLMGLEVTDDMLLEVINAKGKFNEALDRVRNLVENSDPLVLSPTHENVWMCLNALALSIDEIVEATDAFNMIYEELKEKVARGQGVVEKGAPRILAILPAGQTDPRLEYLLCEVGIAAVAIDMSFHLDFNTKSDDPCIKSAMASQQHSLGVTLSGRIPLIVEGCKKLNVDGVFDRYHTGCRSVVADALIIGEAVKKELGIPVLVLEWENFDPRAYNHEEYKKRLEVFKEMMTKRSA